MRTKRKTSVNKIFSTAFVHQYVIRGQLLHAIQSFCRVLSFAKVADSHTCTGLTNGLNADIIIVIISNIMLCGYDCEIRV